MSFLCKKTIRGITYLQLVKSEHVAGKRAPRKIVLKNYGRYEKVPEEIRKAFEDAKAKKEMALKLEQELRTRELEEAKSAIETAGKEKSSGGESNAHFNKALALHYGHLALKGIWERELDLRYKLNYLQKRYTKIESWSLNDLLFYLCSLKVISPSSYLSASENKTNFFYCPWANVAQDNFYNALDFVCDHGDELIKHAVLSHLKETKQEIKVAFFDCTNTYFETPYDDVAWQTIRFMREQRAILAKEGKKEEEIEAYFDSDEFASALEKELEKRSGEVLRMRGPSKEERFSLPIVTVALAIDQSGFPIDCKVVAGNISELKTVSPILSSLKEKYKVKDIYFVADRGLNSTQSLSEITERKLGFVVAQKVSRQKKSVRDEMLSLDGYRNARFNEINELVDDDNQSGLNENAFRYKVCRYTRSAFKECESENKTGKDKDKNKDGGDDKVKKREKITVSCNIVYTFSPQRKARELAALEEQIAKATQAVNEGKLMGNACGSGWRALIKTRKESALNKTDIEQYRAVGLKEDVINDKRAIAGYAAIVYDAPEGKQGNALTAEQVLSTYHRLVRIEDCFRVMKSNFNLRPVYVRNLRHITAHCYMCVLSLMLMRSLQMKLESSGFPMPSGQICNALRQALLLPLPSKNPGIQSFLNVGLNQIFNNKDVEKPGRKRKELSDTVNEEQVWSAFEKERETKPDDLDLILKTAGLKSLKVFNTMTEIKSNLGLSTCQNEIMISKCHLRYLSKVTDQM